MASFDELQAVEDRLKKEREECERLEAQIRVLASGSALSSGPQTAMNRPPAVSPAPVLSSPPGRAAQPQPAQAVAQDNSAASGTKSRLDLVGHAPGDAASLVAAGLGSSGGASTAAPSVVYVGAPRNAEPPSAPVASPGSRSTAAPTVLSALPAGVASSLSPDQLAALTQFLPQILQQVAAQQQQQAQPRGRGRSPSTPGGAGKGGRRSPSGPRNFDYDVATGHLVPLTDAAATAATSPSVAARALSPSARAGIFYRSPMYRSVSPNRRVGRDGVIVSNFSRSPRFRDDRSAVPGPGRYNAPTAFTQTQVHTPDDTDVATATTSGHGGQQLASTGWHLSANATHSHALGSGAAASLSPLHAHEMAMLQATARVKPTAADGTPLALTGATPSLPASRAHTPSKERAAGNPHSLIEPHEAGLGSGGEEPTPEAEEAAAAGAAAALIAAANGNARHALEAAIRRERNMRRQVAAMEKHAASQRMNTASLGGHMRGEVDALNARLGRKSQALDAVVARVRPLKDAFSRTDDAYLGLQKAVNELGTALAASTSGGATDAAALQAALVTYPPLGRLVEAARALDARLQSLGGEVNACVQTAANQLQASNAHPAAATTATGGATPTAIVPASPAPSSSTAPQQPGAPSATTITSPTAAASNAKGDSSFLGYSSLAAALAKPNALNIGQLPESSARYMDKEVAQRKARAAAQQAAADAAATAATFYGSPTSQRAASASRRAVSVGARAYSSQQQSALQQQLARRATGRELLQELTAAGQAGGATATTGTPPPASPPPNAARRPSSALANASTPSLDGQPVDVASKGISANEVLAFAKRSRRVSEVESSTAAIALAANAAEKRGFDVGKATEKAATNAAAARAALQDDQRADGGKAVGLVASLGSSGRGRGSVSPSPSQAGRRPSAVGGLAAAVGAAYGRGATTSLSPSASGSGSVVGGFDGSSVASNTRGVRAGSVTSPAAKPVLRRTTMAVTELPSILPTSPLPARETTIADTLRQIFRYFSKYGDRDSDGTSLRSSQFTKLVRDAGLMGGVPGDAGAPLAPHDIDMAFARAVTATSSASTPAATGASGVSPSGARYALSSRMGFEAFLDALNELAVRKYRLGAGDRTRAGGDSASVASTTITGALAASLALGSGSIPADAEAFRQLVQDHVLTIYPRLKTNAVFVVDVAQLGAEEMASRFASQFLQAEVIAFFNEHRGALQSIFAAYALGDRRIGDAHLDGSSQATVASARLSRKQLLQWALDYKVVPDMLTRPDLMSLLREALRAVGRPDTSEELTYPEWIELLGMIAFVLTDPRATSDKTLTATSHGDGHGESSSSSPLSMLQKIHLLFYNMYENGARFTSGEPHRLIRAVHKAVRADVEAAQKAADKHRRESAVASQRRVADVLGESVVL